MIEILNTLYLFLIFTLLFSLPFNNKFFLHKFEYRKNNFFDIQIFNIILILNIFLIVSFFKINILYLLILFLILSLFNLIFIKSIRLINSLPMYLAIFILFLIYSTKVMNNPELGWDAAVNWIFKTKNFYSNNDFQNLKNVPGINNYPHLGSYIWAVFWRISFVNHEYTGRLIYIFIYLSSIFAATNILKTDIFKKIILGTILSILAFDNILINGYQEPLMFSFCIIFMLFFLKIEETKKIKFNYLFLFFVANLILWTKNEGIFFLIFLSIFILLSKKIFIQHKIVILFFFSFLIFIKSILFNVYMDGLLIGWDGYEFINLLKVFSAEYLKRLPYLSFQVFISFFKHPILILFIVCLIISYCFLKGKSYKNLEFIIFLILNIAMSIGIFYLTNDTKWDFHAAVGLDRILYQTSGLYIIYILKFLNKAYF